MSLETPNLDDRTFEQLVDEARQRAARSCPQWTDLSPGDPGIVLLELFAFLTETMIYRLNRLPEKAYVEFLRLMGVVLHPPAAARVELQFSRTGSGGEEASGHGADAGRRIEIPRGTRVTLQDGGSEGAPVFITAGTVHIEPDQHRVEVLAFHCQEVQGERVGQGNGLPGQAVVVGQPPIVAPTGDGEDLLVGVEAPMAEIGSGRCRQFGGRAFRLWSAREHFAGQGDDPFVYVVDRGSGTITFAPAVNTFSRDVGSSRPQTLAAVPDRDREIRVWYRRGGGPSGNVAAGMLTALVDSVAGVSVTNPRPATGGRAAETTANALIRGPQQLHAQERVVTAGDFERIARASGAVARALAGTKAQFWAYARAGTVEVSLVPEVPESRRPDGQLSVEQLRAHQSDEVIVGIRRTLDQRRALGTRVEIGWMDYKTVRVRGGIRVFHGERPGDIEAQVHSRLNRMISPLPTSSQPTGWPFDQPLRLGRLYDEIFKVPGVKDVEHLRLVVEEVPDQPVRSIAADACQASTWYVISGNAVFRSLDDGLDWQRLPSSTGAASDEEPGIVRTHATGAGFVAVTTHRPDPSAASGILVSEDCGRSWRVALRMAFPINDVLWIQRAGRPALLIAAARGLYELAMDTGDLTHVVMSGLPPDVGFWTVTTRLDASGEPVAVAAAARDGRGVWISHEGGLPMTFLSLGLENEDVRVLAFQDPGSRWLLWAGVRVVGNRPGRGCFRWDGPAARWQQVIEGWRGGSCLALAARGAELVAATYDGGVLRLDAARTEGIRWRAGAPDCGLPRRDGAHPHVPVTALAVGPRSGVLMTGCEHGVYRSTDRGLVYQSVCQTEFVDSVSLPRQTLFCAGRHELTVRSEDDS